ncbi:hypothetical protein D477_012163 [Arthrobacter crystallopoietes BAB-32]|uniref:Uncharacterized protein n=1 Tax=Arthrobacter crystallopoietes BAB-32 TaxID=1246476 RepID=N1V6T4_9MICC|nr:DUF664 domain-containing protein [Arthrobacter crystallopoietes]EMY33968.1 hypothetical protein D477_012163 [Arthrobacter crystallopoietes BAB-32]
MTSGNAAPQDHELDTLLAFLAQQRYVLRLTAYGLTEEQVRLSPTASTLCIGGLIKHIPPTAPGRRAVTSASKLP